VEVGLIQPEAVGLGKENPQAAPTNPLFVWQSSNMGF
jgi:hypothetical protein